MPTGVAFFTGNATVQLASNVKNITLPVKQEAPRVARPNENIDTFETATTTYLDHKTVHEAESSDSDVTVRDEEDEPFDVNGLEKWPPTRYDSFAPLSLPFGPRTAATRKLLASEGILADPNDADAVAQEEQSSLFVLQMPSDLKYVIVLHTIIRYQH